MGDLRERNKLKNLGVDGSLVLKWVLSEMERRGLDRSVSRQGLLSGSCDCGNEPSGSIKCEKFLE